MSYSYFGIIWYSTVNKLRVSVEAGEHGNNFMNRTITSFIGIMFLLI
jgi:hypothetical protein